MWVSLQRNRSSGESDEDVELPAIFGDPIGRYVAKFRVGLTCKPEPGRRLFVEVVRTDAFSQQVTYSFPLGVFEITGSMDDPQVIEIPFVNLGQTRDRIAVKVSELNKLGTNPKGRRNAGFPDSTKPAYVWVDWLEVEGPIIEQWPPAAWQDIFFNGEPSQTTNESVYAREIIERFAFRAFRHRKPAAEYVDKIHGLYRGYRDDGISFVDAVKESLSVVLASPSFVYLVESRREPTALAAGAAHDDNTTKPEASAG